MSARDIVLAAAASVIWGLAFVAIRLGLDGFSAPQLTALRFIIAARPVVVLKRPAISLPMLILVGSTLFSGQFLLLFFAYEAGMPPGLASVTQQMQAFFTVGLAALFLCERPSRRQAAGMAVAFCGLGLIGLTTSSDLSAIGLALALGAATSWAVGNILLKRLGPIPMFPLMAWLSLVPPLPALAVSSLVDPGASLIAAIGNAPWAALAGALYIGFVGTSIAYAIWGDLLARYPSALVAPFALLSPCAGVIASAIVFGERFGEIRYAGMAAILAGLAVILVPVGGRRRGSAAAQLSSSSGIHSAGGSASGSGGLGSS